MDTLIITENVELYGVILADAGKVIQFPYPGFSEKRKVEWLFYRFTNCRKLRYPFFRSWMHYVFRKPISSPKPLCGVLAGFTLVRFLVFWIIANRFPNHRTAWTSRPEYSIKKAN